MKDQNQTVERLQAQVAAMQQQHNRLVLQIQQLEAKLRQLEGRVQAVPRITSTITQEELSKHLQSTRPTLAPHSPKPAWAPHQQELVGLDSVALSVLHGLATPV